MHALEVIKLLNRDELSCTNIGVFVEDIFVVENVVNALFFWLYSPKGE